MTAPEVPTPELGVPPCQHCGQGAVRHKFFYAREFPGPYCPNKKAGKPGQPDFLKTMYSPKLPPGFLRKAHGMSMGYVTETHGSRPE